MSDHLLGSKENPIRREGVQLVASTPHVVVGMAVYQDRLFVATAEGVFERGVDGVFRECRLEQNSSVTWGNPAPEKIVR